MSSTDIVIAATTPPFPDQCGFSALKVAQQIAAEPIETPNHANRVNYSNRIFTGAESNVLLARHIAASNPTIAAALEAGDPVPDADVEFALASIWDARANAFSTGVQFGVTGDPT